MGASKEYKGFYLIFQIIELFVQIEDLTVRNGQVRIEHVGIFWFHLRLDV